MAIAKGQESKEGAGFKRYIGIAPCFVKAVNPTKAELEMLLNTQLENDPEYIGEQDDNGQKIQTARVSFLVQPDPDKTGMEVSPITVSLWLRKQYRYNKDKTKVQVIDKYGRTAWVTSEELKTHAIPQYSNGPANLDPDYRPCYVGEEDLTNFLIAYLNIPSVMKYNQTEKKWYMVDNPQDSECRLDHIEDYFKGNFSELQECVTFQPQNKVKILFGVKTNSEGRLLQAVYTQMFLRNSVNDFTKLEKDVQDRKANGAYGTTEFEIGPFREYSVNETTFSANEPASDPFGNPSAPSPWDTPTF